MDYHGHRRAACVSDFDKKSLSERDICSKFILPAILDAGWDLHSQIREEYGLTAGRIEVRGSKTRRRKAKRADFALFWKSGIPLAAVEAKDNNHSVEHGMQQALDYAGMLDVPFAFSSNGDAFVFHDKLATDGQIEREIALNEFPSPAELWDRYAASKPFAAESRHIVAHDYLVSVAGKTVPILDVADIQPQRFDKHRDDPERCEYFVAVRWLKTVAQSQPFWEKGLFASQHSACKLRHSQTIAKVCEHFGITGNE